MPSITAKDRLALDGGHPVRTAPLAPWPYYAPDERKAVEDVLLSGKVNYWTGNECRMFEEEFARYCGRRRGLVLANGTVALELALLALQIGEDDEVIVTCRTFLASASAIVARGGIPVVVDIDRSSQNMTPESVEAAITPRTRGILVVHLAGWPCEMDGILAVARKYGLKVIEDCAQAHGARYRGRPVGSFGEASAFSFCQDKILSTGGEGGILLLDEEAAWNRAWSYRDHGKDYEAMVVRKHPPGFRWIHEGFGTNWRMTEMQAALGRTILPKLDGWVNTRRAHAAYLNQRLNGLDGIRLTVPPDHIYHSYYRYCFFVEPGELRSGWTRDRIVAAINAEGVPVTSGPCGEIHREKAFAILGRPTPDLPVARELFATTVMCLVHPTLQQADLEDTAQAISRVMRAATA